MNEFVFMSKHNKSLLRFLFSMLREEAFYVLLIYL